MSKTVNRQEVLRTLEAVSPGLSTREIIEQSGCFVFANGLVRTYNDLVSCSAPSPFGKLVNGAVQAQGLLELFRRLSEDDLIVSATDSEIQLAGKGRRAGVRLEAQVVLPVDQVEAPMKWNPIHDSFGDAVGLVHLCAGTDASMFSLTCVHVTPKWVEACDNYQMCRWRLKTGFTQNTLIRRDSVRHATGLGASEVSEGRAWVHFRNSEGITLSCRATSEEYPDLSPFLKADGGKAVLPKGLAEAAEKAGVFSADAVDEDNVLIDLRPGKLRIKGEGAIGWYEEVKRLFYDGPPLTFSIKPKLLIDIVTRHSSEASIGAKRLVVDGGPYTYSAVLRAPETKKKQKPDSEGEDE